MIVGAPGMAPTIVKFELFETPPPGVGLKTVTLDVPTAEMSVAVIEALI